MFFGAGLKSSSSILYIQSVNTILFSSLTISLQNGHLFVISLLSGSVNLPKPFEMQMS